MERNLPPSALETDLFNPVGHKILLITMAVWAIAQTIKVILGVIVERRFTFRWFIGTGGMPSSHAAGATALATLCGMCVGFKSIAFALAAVFALVTMFDAQGVRRATGQQAEVLNKIVEDIYRHGNIPVTRLKELVGHTPFQVFIGALIGGSLAVVFYNLWIK